MKRIREYFMQSGLHLDRRLSEGNDLLLLRNLRNECKKRYMYEFPHPDTQCWRCNNTIVAYNPFDDDLILYRLRSDLRAQYHTVIVLDGREYYEDTDEDKDLVYTPRHDGRYNKFLEKHMFDIIGSIWLPFDRAIDVEVIHDIDKLVPKKLTRAERRRLYVKDDKRRHKHKNNKK